MMSRIQHSAVLTPQEHASIQLHTEFQTRILSNPNRGTLKVLDWGCGRGSDVLHLLSLGVQAFGAEPSADTIERGKPVFESAGLDHSAIIKQIASDNSTPFADATFDMLISYQVLEHVEHIDTAAREMFRVMKAGGTAVHLYPSHRRPIEGHLFMPLVHWLPKNRLRYSAIRLCTQFGIEPRWPSLANESRRNKASTYFEFSCRDTYYRNPRKITERFGAAGFETSFESHNHAKIRKLHIDRVVPQPILSWLLTTFVGCVLICRKPILN
jgi:ubiquinone/menaquinone biosynthesis C-methylase UbiE